MSKQEPESSTVAISVSRRPDMGLFEAIQNAGISPSGDLKSLGARQGLYGAEILLDGLSDDEKTRLAAALDTLDADTALLPALNRRKQLLICDMDSTIIQEECLDELADFAGLKAEISAITERAMRGELNFEGALTTRVAMLDGLPLHAIDDCYMSRIHLSPGAQTLVATMKAHGAHCLLVSGGFTAFTSRVANAAGFHDNHANTLLDDGTALTGKVRLPILGREAKLERLNLAAADLGLHTNDALAMGDGANDLAMIEAAGLGIAYRAKPIVAAKADATINLHDLTTALFFQGFHADEFVNA